jgi:hypothetical protein
MQVTTIHQSPYLAVYDYRCDAVPGENPLVEWHTRHALAFVRRGGFGYRTLDGQR